MTLTPKLSNSYTRNRAVFDITNELVLSDGVLWDVSSGREIHKFDKLNQNVSGIFHPNGLEVKFKFLLLFILFWMVKNIIFCVYNFKIQIL